ncbi:MAG: CehA/McbA family metallohydrolase [Acidobacteria bacterium]|nr:CehA/McbA family metallohydrolase [Acidobacteriota bacterium]MCI0623302.1 CehA/McbA family metallohydrolase [Acidobacteriota bacterium]MCI0720455.1 CehA/McbA family metallohydrolase [Acidobacteriota bacterium]
MRPQSRMPILYLCAIFILFSLDGNCSFGAEKPEPPGWFSGDPHVHRGILCQRDQAHNLLSPQELLEGMRAHDLDVISVLGDIGNGEVKHAEEDLILINGKDHPASAPGRILHWDAEWHFDPEGVAFPEKAIGGHLIVLGLQRGQQIFSEYTYPIFKWARKQNALVGFAHMQYLTDELPGSLNCCLPLEFPVEAALGGPLFLMEDVDGGDSAMQAYYRLLNCSFRPGIAAGTDYPCNNLKPFGSLLTYVEIRDKKLSYRKWIERLVQGRSVVSRNGHDEFLELRVNGAASPGDDVKLAKGGTVQVEVRWTSTKPLSGKVELVRNGIVVETREGMAAPGAPVVLGMTQNFGQSGWLCARRMGEDGHQTHTAAVFVTVGKAPIRASSKDAEYFVRFIDHLIQQTSAGGAWSKYFSRDRKTVQDRYRRARAVYARIAREASRVQP